MFKRHFFHWSASLVAMSFSAIILSGCVPTTTKEEQKPAAGKDTASSKVNIKTVTLAELKKEVAKHKGKIVVMDIWANWCIPCKHEFPKLVKLHNKYVDRGVVCMSLCLPDTVKVDETNEKALAFLKEQKAAFPNFRWHEKADWQEAFDISGPPAVRVYGTDGKLAKQFDHNNPDVEWGYPEIEALVTKLQKK